jgi:class 3 adenylate cyclase
LNAPTGTVTFLFTDIEGSTKLWEQQPEPMRIALARHDALMRQAIADHSGVAFPTASDVLNAALTVQLALTPPE